MTELRSERRSRTRLGAAIAGAALVAGAAGLGATGASATGERRAAAGRHADRRRRPGRPVDGPHRRVQRRRLPVPADDVARLVRLPEQRHARGAGDAAARSRCRGADPGERRSLRRRPHLHDRATRRRRVERRRAASRRRRGRRARRQADVQPCSGLRRPRLLPRHDRRPGRVLRGVRRGGARDRADPRLHRVQRHRRRHRRRRPHRPVHA